MAEIIAVSDLPTAIQSHEMVDAMVAGANAKASRVAPCLTWDGTVVEQPAASSDQVAEARLVLIGAVKRWAEAGSGAIQSQTAGIFATTTDTRQRTGYNLWPSEISNLQDICKNGAQSAAFSIDTVGSSAAHLPWCASMFGANYCSCGADIAEYPIYELG